MGPEHATIFSSTYVPVLSYVSQEARKHSVISCSLGVEKMKACQRKGGPKNTLGVKRLKWGADIDERQSFFSMGHLLILMW